MKTKSELVTKVIKTSNELGRALENIACAADTINKNLSEVNRLAESMNELYKHAQDVDFFTEDAKSSALGCVSELSLTGVNVVSEDDMFLLSEKTREMSKSVERSMYNMVDAVSNDSCLEAEAED